MRLRTHTPRYLDVARVNPCPSPIVTTTRSQSCNPDANPCATHARKAQVAGLHARFRQATERAEAAQKPATVAERKLEAGRATAERARK